MKLIVSMFVAVFFLSAFSLYADQDSNDVSTMIRNNFGIDSTQYDPACKSVRRADRSVATYDFAYQYTNDGWLQQVAIYLDSVICTNLAGPREGLQLIIANNGALMDMCDQYTSHKDHITHKYSWGEVRTYQNYQIVNFK